MLTKSIALIAVLFSLNSWSMMAETTSISPGDVRLESAGIEVISIRSICPKTAGTLSCMAMGSKITFRVILNNCADRLGPIFHKLDRKSNGATLYVAAVNIVNEASESVTCVTAPTVIKSITVPFEGKIDLKQLNHQSTGSNSYLPSFGQKTM